MGDVARFAIPAGVSVGAGVLGAYLISLHAVALSVTEARTVATTVLLTGMLFLIVLLERRPARRRRAVEILALFMAGCFAAVLLMPPARRFFALAAPDAELLAVAALGSLAAWGLAAAALATRRTRT